MNTMDRRKTMYVEYDSNNSGGRWWLTDQNWKDLEKAGWKVEWRSLECKFTDDGDYDRDEDGTPKLVPVGEGGNRLSIMFPDEPDENGEYRFLGALATRAYRVGIGFREAVDEWQRVTGLSSTAAGCPCCGQPHSFTLYDDNGKYVKSGPDVEYVAKWEDDD
jgi:hypothetical protein